MATSFASSPQPGLSQGMKAPGGHKRSSSSSFFQQFVLFTERLYRVPGFDQYMDATHHPSNDPVATLWDVFRQGHSLTHLYNVMFPDNRLPDKSNAKSSANAAKANVYHFLLALKTKLHFAEEDTFTISELYQDDTNGFVKVALFLFVIADWTSVDLNPLFYCRL
jgi:cell division control protein 24